VARSLGAACVYGDGDCLGGVHRRAGVESGAEKGHGQAPLRPIGHGLPEGVLVTEGTEGLFGIEGYGLWRSTRRRMDMRKLISMPGRTKAISVKEHTILLVFSSVFCVAITVT
jgi:hypothetical protein